MTPPPDTPQLQPDKQTRPTTLNFITGNVNKLAEVRAILSDVEGLELLSRDAPGPEIQGTIEEIAVDKCRRAAKAVSLFFPSLNFLY